MKVLVHDLQKPDLLHKIDFWVLEHLINWIQSFLRKPERFKQFDKA